MNHFIKHILLILLVVLPITSKAQLNPGKVCRVENGQIIFTLDLKWNEKQKKEISVLFELDSTLIAKAYTGATEILSAGAKWKVKKLNSNYVELSISLEDLEASNPANIPNKDAKPYDKTKKTVKPRKDYVFMIDDNWIRDAFARERESSTFGVNNFSKNSIFRYEKGIGHFFLPGFKNSKRVYLVGAFNNWVPNETLMQQTDSGWVVSIKLLPGKYSYKYIVDGKWMTDPNNRNKQNDGYGNINSFLFCYNYLFELKGYLNAKKVLLAGSFNNWNRNELRMNKTSNGWEIQMYLKEGTYTYKFIVDNEWITDPANKNTRNDGAGNFNSVIGIGDSHLFTLKGFTTAKKVTLAGSFNNWAPGELQMIKTNDGWQLPYNLSAGMYEYKFIADGHWMTDPANPYISGSGDMQNSVLAFKPNYTFTLSKYPDAKKIVLAGNFNNWNPNGYRMVKQNNKWVFPIYLPPGKTTYKYLVDNEWILDPDNKLWEENEFGTGNSLLWMK